MSLNRASIDTFLLKLTHVDPRPKNHFFGLLVGASGGTLVLSGATARAPTEHRRGPQPSV